MHVIFVEPRFPNNQKNFVRALRDAGAVVSGIGEMPTEMLGSDLREWLHEYIQVPNVCNDSVMTDAVQRIQKAGPWVDRMEATVEAHMMTAARVREACGIPGTSVETTWLCRDKPAMKEALRKAGVPTAQSIGSDDVEEVKKFVGTIGYPVIVKPRSAAGAAGTYRADDDQELDYVLRECNVDKGASVAVEEFISGHEGFFDTLTVDGEIATFFISHYYPGVLEAMRTRWISAAIITTNRVDAPGYDEVKEMGKKVIDALGIETSATHMEWFFGPKGLKFSEIGCRPPGVQVWDIYGAANDFDVYREWANVLVHGRMAEEPSRRFSGAMINLRPDRDGRIVGYEGVEKIHELFGQWILDYHFPPPGSPTAPIEGGYMVNAWIRLRHPDYDTLRQICNTIGETIQVRAA